MARLFTSGFEINAGSGFEWTTAGGVLSTTTVRSGVRSGRINSLSTGTRKTFAQNFVATAASGPYYFRFYINVATLPSAANTIAAVTNSFSAPAAADARVKLKADGSLGLYAGSTQVGSDSPVAATGVWYEVGLVYDDTPSSGSKVLRAYLDGVEFASSTTLSDIGGVAAFVLLGGNLDAEAQTQGDWFFDDVAVNDGTGSVQNGLPPSGKVCIMFPDSAGDSNQWNNTSNAAGSSTNYQLVDENPPDDSTTMVQSIVAGNIDLYNFETTDVGAADTVNVVQILARHNNIIADATTSYALIVEKTASGTQTQGTTLVPNSTTWRTGSAVSTSTSTTGASLTTYTDPDGAAWTRSTLNSMQAGPKLIAAGSNRLRVSTVWATVDYTPAPRVRFYLANAAPEYTPATKRGAWDDSSASLARKLGYNPEGAAATSAVAETSSSGTHDVLLGRWISPPATSAGTFAGIMNWAIGFVESDAAADMFQHMHIYVTQGDSDTVRGTLYTDYISTQEFSATGTGRAGTNWPITSTAVQVGDRIVVEVGYQAQNVATTSYTGTVHYGNTGTTDLSSGSANISTEPGWIEFTGAYGLWDENAGGGATASPAAIAVTSTFPAVTTTADATATPAAVAATAAFPAVTVTTSADATASPAAVAVTAAFPAVTVTASAVATPAAADVTAAMPSATVTAGATAAPASVAAVAAMPAATVTAGSTTTPDTVTAVAALPAATVTASGTASPAAIPAVADLPTPTVQAGGSATATPATVAAVAAMPAATVSAGSTVTPNPVAVTAAMPTATVAADGTRTPAAVAATTTFGQPAVSAGAAPAPQVVAATASLPTPTPSAAATSTPQVLQVVTVIPPPTVDANSPATATPQPVAALASVLQATVTASGTAVVAPVTVVASFPAVEASAPGSRRPGLLTAGTTRPTHGASGTRPTLTAGTERGV